MMFRRWMIGWLLMAVLLIGCQATNDLSTAVPPTMTAIPVTVTAFPPTLTPIPNTPTTATANADVLHVRAVQTAENAWTFHVTVEHPDNGWDDYADGWDVVLPGGRVVKPNPESPFTRLLAHPHDNEQPFTRSQSGITISPDITEVWVRAHDLVDGFGGREVVVDLTAVGGEDFEIERLEIGD